MSRKGKEPITLPQGVEVKVSDNKVVVKGPKGTLTQEIIPGVNVNIADNQVTVDVGGVKSLGKYHGLYRTLINNMVVGTTKGFEKKLELVGVGYRAALQGNNLNLQLGYSHPVVMQVPEGISVNIEKATQITISGSDKQVVGQFAANIRAKRPPEPYQGKGVKYKDEFIRRKAGKAAAKK